MKGKLQLIKARARAAVQQAQLLIYGDIGDFGDSGVSAKAVAEQLIALDAPEVLVRINSYGGRVDEGLAIYGALRDFDGTVTVRIEGVAASIAGIVAMAGTRVEIAQDAMLMIHSAWQFAEGSAEDLRNAADGLEKADRQLAQIYARKSGRSVDEELEAMQAGGDRWFTAEEALAAGYVDAIYDPDDASASARNPIVCDALTHYLPRSGAYAAALRKRLKAAKHPPTGRKPKPLENRMNWLELARKLGVEVADDADDATIRAAIAAHLGLDEDAEESDIMLTIAERAADAGDGNDGGDGDGASARSRTKLTAAAKATKRKADAKAKAKARAAAGGGADPDPDQPNRREQIEELFDIAGEGREQDSGLRTMRAQALIGTEPIADVRNRLLAHLGSGTAISSTVVVQGGEDKRDKRVRAAGLWLVARAGARLSEEQQRGMNGNVFRGMSLHDLARDCVEEAGIYARSMNRMDIIKAALTHSTSDFPNIFENALHKMVLTGFEVQKPSWDRFCKVSSLSDFRPHIRYRMSSVGDLEVRLENGEYKSLTLSDAERESITGQSRGGILNITREMIVNDDMSVFSGLAQMLGGAAARTLDKSVFALFALNGGNGPTMGDGNPLFHADHGNIATTPEAPTVSAVEAMRVQMASQKDPGGNDFIDLRPDRALAPLSLGGQLRLINTSTYDPDANNKLQRPNIALNLLSDIIDTPRLTGNAWYLLANPNVDPTFEVGFLDGQQTPQLAQEEAFNQAGMKWRLMYEFGTAAVGWRGVIKNAGAGS